VGVGFFFFWGGQEQGGARGGAAFVFSERVVAGASFLLGSSSLN
jgi:hypothetical protein